MGKSCDHELRLQLGLGSSHHEYGSADGDSCNSTRSERVSEWLRNTTEQQQQPEQQQEQITIFYNGRVCVCDATEIQARAIICMARQEADKIDHQKQHYSTPLAPLINPELSMKRSLQRFLQKRKTRMEATMPYSYSRHSPSPLSSSLS